MSDTGVGFRITDGEGNGAYFQRIVNGALIETLMPCIEDMIDRDIAFDVIVQRLAMELSRDTGDMRGLVKGLVILAQMPRTRLAAVRHLHLDESRIKMLGNQLWHLNGEKELSVVDEHFVKHVTPQTQNEELVLSRTLSTRCKEILDHIGAQREAAYHSKDRNRATITQKGEHVEFVITLDLARGRQLEAQLEKVREQLACDLPEAFAVCLRLDKAPEVILHAVASTNGGIYLDNGMRLSREDFADVDLVKTAILNPHREVEATEVPEDMATLVRGRDGSCRAPYCEKPAHLCQVEHVIAPGTGGRTNPANLHAVCLQHSQAKSRGKISVIQHPNGLNVWTLEDESTINTLPHGALSSQVISGDIQPAA